jgi:hypothetical protein
MSRKRVFAGESTTKELAVEEGRKLVSGTGRIDKLYSPYKSYEVKKVNGMWRLYLIEKTTYEKLHGKKYH